MMHAAAVALAVASLVFVVSSFAADAGQGLPRKPDSTSRGKVADPGAPPTTMGRHALHWYENGHKRTLRVEPGWIADFASAPARPAQGLPRTPLKRFVGGEKALDTLPDGASPVFRDDNGATRALPGGVVVRLREADVGQARARLADAGLIPVRPLDPEGRSWLVEAPPGWPSLHLANQLHESGRFESATPDWWRPRALK